MKEQTYGWYPSAKDVYKDRRMGVPTPYQLQAMYQYRTSGYYTEPKVPEQALPPQTRQTPVMSPRRPASSVSHASDASSKKSEKYSNIQLRAKSAPITTYRPPPRLQIPTPMQCWSTHVPETQITIPPTAPPSPAPASSPSRSVSVQISAKPSPPIREEMGVKETEEIKEAERTSATQRERIKRIQSAKIRRDVPTPPQRPIRSAGSQRPTPQPPSVPPPATKDIPSRPASKMLRPKAPTPMEDYEDREMIESPVPTPDLYDQQLKKHGWMMEVHGDPLRLKKVTKRLPYTVKVTEPEMAPDPPKVHMENMETFFYNTIPRRPMAFAINKEWISEVIHAKRMELQKREGFKYRWKNFSFVY